jgi:hypothetical protein
MIRDNKLYNFDWAKAVFMVLVIFIMAVMVVNAEGQALQTPQRDTQTGATGATLTFSNGRGDNTFDFEYIFSGTPTSNSIVLSGCHIGGTCDVLDTYTTVNTNVIKGYNGGRVYDYFTVGITVGGGTNPKLQVNRVSVRAGAAGSGGLPSGFVGIANQIKAPDGLVGAPSYAFSTSPNTGMWLPAANQIMFSLNGAKALQLSTNTFFLWSSGGNRILAMNSLGGRIDLPAGGGISAASGTDATGTFDTQFVRLSAGIWNVGATGTADGQLALAGMRSNTASNSDLGGLVTLSTGAGTYTFAKTYTSAPICVATDTTTAAVVKASTTTTVLTLAGTGSDVIAYMCAGRN